MSKVKALYHIVFCNKRREMTINPEHETDLYRYIWKEVTNNKSELIRIGGIANHIHMLINLNPSVALSKMVMDIKAHSSGWMRDNPMFPHFSSWAPEYYACSLSPESKNNVIEYINNQKTHHGVSNFDDELKRMCRYANLSFDDRDLR